MNTTAATTIEIPTTDSFPVRGDLYLPPDRSPTGIVILCHGFKGYKTWGFLPYLAASLRDTGLAALSIDLSHNGTFPSPDGETTTKGRHASPDRSTRVDYIRPDLFERNTLKREYEDLSCVIRYAAEGGLEKWIKAASPIGLYGHSRGGVVAILNAIEQPEVAALCTWSTIDDPDFLTPEQKAKWRKMGSYEFVDVAGGQSLRVGLDYLNDLEENHRFYLVGERVKELRVPHLIVHGKVDLVVKVDCALALHEAERNLRTKRLVLLQAGHTFGVPYPEPVNPGKPAKVLRYAVEETVRWFQIHLSEASPHV